MGDILPVPTRKLKGKLFLPQVRAKPLLSMPAQVRISLRWNSYFEVRIVAEDGSKGLFLVPLQPYRAAARGDKGMLVVNLCSASIGFLHQVLSIDKRQNTSFSANILCTSSGSAPPANISLHDVALLCDSSPPDGMVEVAGLADALTLLGLAPTSDAVGPLHAPTAPSATVAVLSPTDFCDIDGLITPGNTTVLGDEHIIDHVPILLPASDEVPMPPLLTDDNLQFRRPAKGDYVVDVHNPNVADLLHCDECFEDATDPDGRRRSTRLRAKEAPIRETVA